MINREEVKKISQLARIRLSESEEESFEKDLSSILDYVDTLSEVDVSGVKPAAHAIDIFNVVREDKEEILDEEMVADIVKSAPDHENGFIKVKAVL